MHTSHLSHRPHRFEDPSLSSAFLPLIVEAGVCLTTHDTGGSWMSNWFYASFNSQSSRSHSCYRSRLQRDCASIPSFQDSLDMIWLVPCSFHSYRLAFNFSGHTISVISLLFGFQNDFWGGVSFPFLFFEFRQLQNCFIILRCCKRTCSHFYFLTFKPCPFEYESQPLTCYF